MRVVFVGPSLHGELSALNLRFPQLEVRGPAKRGDIAGAARDGADAIGLIDGCFGDVPAVWHKEILFALENRVPIGGGASMGALRAAECSPLGMTGIGSLFREYRDGTILDDEAVAVAHAPAELSWMPLSVPWVNFAATVERARAEALVDVAEADLLMLAGRHLHFAQRTFAGAAALCAPLADARRKAIGRLLPAVLVDRKKEDAWAVVEWLANVAVPGKPQSWTLARTTQWLALERAETAAA